MSESNNPLLGIERSPAGPTIPFDQIEAHHVTPAVRTRLAEAQQAVDAIAASDAPLTYDTTLAALDRATEPLEVVMTLVGHLESVSSTPALREAYNTVKPDVSAFYASIPLNDALHRTLKAFAETESARALAGSEKRHLTQTLDSFRRHGAELPAPDKERLKSISRRLAELTARFAQNVVDETADFDLCIDDEQRLAGLPDSAKAAARQSAEHRGQPGWRLTLQAPSFVPAMMHLEDAALRADLYKAYNTRAVEAPRDNPALITEILALRSEQAKLLGYAHFADLVLEPRMAKNGQAAVDFVQRLRGRTEAAFEAENDALAAFRRSIDGPNAPALEPWDVAFYAEKQRRALYDFDDEALRPYFALESVLDGLFEIVHRLYGVKVASTDLPTWHEEVRSFRVDDADGTVLGYFYADLHPRDAKRGGAWMNGLWTGLPGTEAGPHVGLICANLARPLADQPALLNHQEVSTLFHEFGHLLHHLLSRVNIRSLAGTRVAWDFVELPSQIMENWCWEREALDLFARHHETGAPIPDALLSKMQRARNYRAANAMMRQLGFAAVDLALHTGLPPPDRDVLLDDARALMAPYAPAPQFEGSAFVAGFGHLFSSSVGYAAGYYSYKWAEVLDADAFTRFKSDGVFSAAVGTEFRRTILETGDGDDPMALYQRFMGRPPDPDALLRRAGLAA